MSARLVLLLRWIGFFGLGVAAALILVRWKWPSGHNQKRTSLSFWRELWRLWIERRRDARERSRSLGNLRGRCGLIADPDEKSLRVAAWKFEALGCRVARARTGAQALVEVRKSCPEFILADAMLPDISAADFFWSLGDCKMPVVFLGVLAAQLDGLRRLGRNVVCLGKPFDPDEAAAMVAAKLQADA